MVGLCLIGCRPRGVVSQQKMMDLLYDLHKAEGVLQQAGYSYGNDEELNKYYAVVLEQHGVTKAQLDSSLVWYTAHPRRFAYVYPAVVARLEAETEALRKLSEQHNPDELVLLTEEDVQTAIDSTMQCYAQGLRLQEPWSQGWNRAWKTDFSEKNAEKFVYVEKKQ